jgi:hypothetical protein
MASFSFPALLPPLAVPSLPPMPVGAVTAVAPVALLQAELDALPLPQPAPALPAPAAETTDGAAMRPDQVIMSRQLNWPTPDGGTLASSWRGMVRNYGTQFATREQQARAGQVPAAILLSGQPIADARVLRQAELLSAPQDAWRFTVHANGARGQHLRVVQGEPEQQPERRRRRARAALRLELVLADGSIVTVQAEPVADGVRIEVWAQDSRTAASSSGCSVRVLGWKYVEILQDGPVHARLPSAEAASALSLPVFRAVAELALLLPA